MAISRKGLIVPTRKEGAIADIYPRFARLIKFSQFISHFEMGEEDECWEWKGNTSNGYGKFIWREKGIYLASQAAYEFFVGRIPRINRRRQYCICHSCDNPACVNPKHLWLGTQQQNIEDMIRKGRRVFIAKRGEENHFAKLSSEDVRIIRKDFVAGNRIRGQGNVKELAERFGVAADTIYRIVNQDRWVN